MASYSHFESKKTRFTRETIRKVDVMIGYISQHYSEHGYAPSLRWLGEQMGISSTSSVYYILRVGVHLGLIAYAPNQARTWRVVGDE